LDREGFTGEQGDGDGGGARVPKRGDARITGGTPDVGVSRLFLFTAIMESKWNSNNSYAMRTRLVAPWGRQGTLDGIQVCRDRDLWYSRKRISITNRYQ
jgi:hypothetical protein